MSPDSSRLAPHAPDSSFGTGRVYATVSPSWRKPRRERRKPTTAGTQPTVRTRDGLHGHDHSYGVARAEGKGGGSSGRQQPCCEGPRQAAASEHGCDRAAARQCLPGSKATMPQPTRAHRHVDTAVNDCGVRPQPAPDGSGASSTNAACTRGHHDDSGSMTSKCQAPGNSSNTASSPAARARPR